MLQKLSQKMKGIQGMNMKEKYIYTFFKVYLQRFTFKLRIK